MTASVEDVAPWFALFALCLSFAGFLAAAWMRTLFAAIAAGYAGALFAAVALAALGQGGAALGVSVVGAVGVLAAMGAALLAPRAARAHPRLGFVMPGAAALVLCAALLWAAPDVIAPAGPASPEAGAPMALVALIICVGGLGAYALLGAGPRSALSAREDSL